MKIEPIKQIMSSKARLEVLAAEVHLHKIRLKTGKFTLSDARMIAGKQAKHNESDPYLFARTVSGLMNASLTPGDLEKSRN